MKLYVVGIDPIEWPAPTVAENAHQRWSTRRGLRVTIADEETRRGIGVAAPLPGYAPDDVVGTRAALADFCFDAWRVGDAEEAIRAAVETLPTSCPAARFAVESALFDLARRTSGWRPWFDGIKSTVRSAALVSTFDAVAVERALLAGATTIKMKVGHPGRLEDELAAVAAATDRATVRIDANGTLDRAAVERFAALPIEFIEEPGVFVSGVPAALDESIRRADFEARLRTADVRLIVLKPMVLGGVWRCLDLAQRARRHGVDAIASHTFDGPIAHAQNILLARMLPPTAYHHGLGVPAVGGL